MKFRKCSFTSGCAANRILGPVLALALSMVWALPSNTALAQGRNASAEGDRPSPGGPRRQLATIIYSGLGGAVLGLSTLSFYGRPQDKLSNIAVGFAVGVIAGTIAVTYNAATNPDEFYGRNEKQRPTEYLRTTRDLLGPESERNVLASRRSSEPDLNFEFAVMSF
jgi:hypothetical protein